MVVVARFLALLEMFRDAAIAFDQASPLGELTVRWTGPDRDWSAERLSEEYEDVPLPGPGTGAGQEGHGGQDD
jgi:segregation and condensation protein A